MVDRVTVPVEEGITNTPADNMEAKAGKPAWLPDKFASPEDMAKSYKELEAQYTRLRQGKAADEPAPVEESKPAEEAATETPDNLETVKELLPGFSEDQIMEFSQTAWENGELTDDQYKALEGKGYDREIVDQYIQGQMALAEAQRVALVNAGGGEKAVDQMFTWAAQSLDKATIEAYNAKFDAGGVEALMAMESLKAKYEASGLAPGRTFVQGANAPTTPTDVFRSVAQVTEAMSDPRYKTDPAYRQAVAEKLGRSNVL